MAEDLQYRLYNYSIPPPTDAWPNIAAELERDAEHTLSLKLQAAALQPPANAWENIVSILDEVNQPKVIPITRKWTRIAIAAIAIGIIVLAGLFYFLSNNDTKDRSASTRTKQAPAPAVSNTQPSNNEEVVDNAVDDENINNPVPVTVARRSNKTPVRYARVESMDLSNNQANVNVDDIIQQPVSLHSGTQVAPRDYLTVEAPNGQPAKISAKFTDGLGYLFNNEPLRNMDMALKSISWKRRFNNWSDKLMANTGFIPAASNFLDIVALEEMLKEQ